MEKLSEKGVYELLRTNFAMDIDHRFKEHSVDLLQMVSKLIDANTATLNGLLSACIDDVHDEVLMELEQLHGEMPKEALPPPPDRPSSSRLTRNGRISSVANFLGIDNDH
ncbi:hypothetical protein D1007_33398 [Hordeum vulgare]|nr:hypothetical protein D1007_33398 [Hordeum vulgare]